METIGFLLVLCIGLVMTLAGLVLMIGAAHLGSSHKSDRIVPLLVFGIGVWCLYYAYMHSPWVLVARGGV